MKRLAVLVFLFLIPSFGQGLLFGQFKPEEIARRAEMEAFLRSAEIVRFEPVGEGVTKPYLLYLKKGDFKTKAIWKNPSGMMRSFWEGWQYEIAAYRLDKLIGLHMVPVAVERAFQGKKGALLLWAESKYSLLKVFDVGIHIPDEAQGPVEKMKWLTRAWDSLIANEDRTQQNILYTEDWRTILIDHARAFRSDGEFVKRLMFGRNGIKVSQQGTAWLFRRLPRVFVEKIATLTFANIQAAVGTTLKDREIDAILARRDLLLKEVEQMVKEQGEAAVLY